MDFKEVIESRRAVNFFDPAKAVSDDELREAVERAALSPSSFNLQPWNLIVVRSREAKERLRKLAMNQPKVTEAPVVLVVLADREGFQAGNPTLEQVWQATVSNGYMKAEQKEWFIGATRGLYGTGERPLAFAVKNTAFFAMSFMLAARDMGLDTHPMDGFDYEGVMKEFSIPQRYHVPLLIAVGRFEAGKKLFPRNWRKPYDQIVISTL